MNEETSHASNLFLDRAQEESPVQQVLLPQANRHVLKRGDTFAIVNPTGDIPLEDDGGVYFRGTRHVSGCSLRLFGGELAVLKSWMSHDGLVLHVEAMNAESGQLERGVVHVVRQVHLVDGGWLEQVRLTNHGVSPLDVRMELFLEADFKDLFEVRGAVRMRRGNNRSPRSSPGVIELSYEGLDGYVRVTRAELSGAESSADGHVLGLMLSIPPGEQREVGWSLQLRLLAAQDAPSEDSDVLSQRDFSSAMAQTRRELSELRARDCVPHFSDPRFDRWFSRSYEDLYLLSQATASGLFPYAGVPWFSTPFGRDSLLTALQVLWAMPQMARGVLEHLAALQAVTSDAGADAEPGKILHESRDGEMANLKEIPFGRYYGSIDSTPLFVMLAVEYYRTTGDRGFLHSMLPHIDAALGWIDQSGDIDGDGFVEYARRAEGGLLQQGWKDSHDSVFHADGRDALAPIALSEVQGYVYAAKRGAAVLYEDLGRTRDAERLRSEAVELRERFDRAFWCEELSCYALALDGEKQPCRVRTSNAGHCLFTGIALPERAAKLAETLLAPDMFSGWGVRTLSSLEKRYNPLSYHNGSVWPHDTALVAAGLARYGLADRAARIFGSLLELSEHMENYRLPELLCGMPRNREEPPIMYPIACSPQAWAAAVPFLALQASLGLQVDGIERVVSFHRPVLPVAQLKLSGLHVGTQRVDLLLKHTDGGTVVAECIDVSGPGVKVRVTS